MKTLYLLCGIPASGKSTWARAHADATHIHVSRDDVRNSILKDGEEHFSHEKQVYREWIKRIQNALDDPKIEAVFADATHLNEISRSKTLWHLKLAPDTKVIPVVFDTPYETCYYRNRERKGRAHVPNRVMWQMHENWAPPLEGEYVKIEYVKE